MKTLYVITKSNWGGAQKYVFDQATMRLKYPEARVAVALGGNGELAQRLVKAGVLTHRIPHLERDINPFKDILVCASLFSIYKKEQPDVIHLNSSKIGVLGALAGRIYNIFTKKKAKIIFTAHGWAFNEDRNVISKYIITLISRLTVQLCHEIIVLSKFEHDQVVHWRGALKKLRIEKLRVSPITFKTREEARQLLIARNLRLSEHTNRKWLGTIAELHPNKGLTFGIEAVREVRDKNMIWIIVGEGEARARLQKMILDENLYNKIFLLGYMPHASALLKAFDAFMLPSIKEGLPYVLLEAEQAKLPIIATHVGGIPEYFTKPHNHIVEPKNTHNLAEAITKVI
jgi:glycosyltransferase involved in cell wall biosynthesis